MVRTRKRRTRGGNQTLLVDVEMHREAQQGSQIESGRESGNQEVEEADGIQNALVRLPKHRIEKEHVLEAVLPFRSAVCLDRWSQYALRLG